MKDVVTLCLGMRNSHNVFTAGCCQRDGVKNQSPQHGSTATTICVHTGWGFAVPDQWDFGQNSCMHSGVGHSEGSVSAILC